MRSLRKQISTLPARLLWEVTCTHFSKLELSSDKRYLKWDSMKCQQTSLWRVRSGTSILSSNLKVILPETCTILSSSKTQSPVTTFPKTTALELKRHMKRVLRIRLDTERVGRLKKPEKISWEHILQQYPHKCFTNLRRRQKGRAASNQWNIFQSIESSAMKPSTPLIWLSSIKSRALLLIRTSVLLIYLE